MALKLKITADEHAGLAKVLQPFYEKTSDGFALQIDGLEGDIDETIRTQAQEARDEAARLRKLLKQRSTAEGDFEELTKELRNENSTLKTRLVSAVIERDAIAAIEKQGGNVKLLLPHFRERYKLNDEFKPIGYTDDGKPMLRKGYRSLDDHKSMDEYAGDLASDPEWAGAFKSNGARGSNAQPTTVKAKSANYTVDADGGLHFDN